MMTLIPGIGCRMFVNKKTPLGYDERKYGLLYNWYAANDSRNIAADGWHLFSITEQTLLRNYLGGTSTVGGRLKEVGLIYWNSPNGGALNDVLFNGRGSGSRSSGGGFSSFMSIALFWNTYVSGSSGYGFQLISISDNWTNRSGYKQEGWAVRLVKNSTTLSHGQTGTYTGNDGKVYRTICIGTQEWLADNLAETKYRNGDSIPEVTDATAWSALTTGALCAYNNDWSNV